MATVETLLLIVCFLLPNPILVSSSSPSPSLALDGCQEICNGVTIPYPFGVGESCYLDINFNLTCPNPDANALNPLYGGYNVSKISLDGFLLVDTFVASDCYEINSDKTTTHMSSITSAWSPKFPFSTSRNRFTAVGCDTAAFLWNPDTRSQTGCMSLCEDETSVVDGECNGVGCCQTAYIAENLNFFNVSLTSFYNFSMVMGFDPCSYAFLVDKDSYSFNKSDFKRLQSVSTVQTALDWAIGKVYCSEAKSNGSYACKENSDCYDSDNGPGYRCNCSSGYYGNPYIKCQDINECDDPNQNTCKGKCINIPGSYYCVEPVDHTLEIAAISGGLVFILLVILCSSLCIYLKRRHINKCKEQNFRQNGGLSLQDNLNRRQGSVNTVKIFKSEELDKATDNFSEERIAGRGGFGTVYKGYLSDGTVIAVKKSKIVDQSQIDEFINEVMVISQINHRNVVKFLGCCLETPVPLLVYEFINNGTLFDHLHNEHETIPWETRLRVAAEAAGVLAYLHSAHAVPIIHRDIKPMNILLDENYTAKVSDFGTSRLAPQNENEMCTLVKGTLGYLDPEYMHTSQLTEKSDVYSFGVVLVELLTGKKAVSFERPEEERSLVMYFMSALREGRLVEILDRRIWSEEKVDQMVQVGKIAKLCLRVRGEERPTMKEVAMEIEGLRSEGKHKWVDDNAKDEEERKHLLSQALCGYDGNTTTASGSTTSGFCNTGDHIMLISMGNGR